MFKKVAEEQDFGFTLHRKRRRELVGDIFTCARKLQALDTLFDTSVKPSEARAKSLRTNSFSVTGCEQIV